MCSNLQALSQILIGRLLRWSVSHWRANRESCPVNLCVAAIPTGVGSFQIDDIAVLRLTAILAPPVCTHLPSEFLV